LPKNALRKTTYITNRKTKFIIRVTPTKIIGSFVVFRAYINEMHGSRSKIASKKSRKAALRGGI
jgi:hypothetical protein